MTIELRLGITASPEDLFGRKGAFMRDWSGIDRLVRVADQIDEVKPLVEGVGLKMLDFHDEWLVFKEGATLQDVEVSLFKDRVDGFVWVAEQEVEKFKNLFKKNSSEGLGDEGS